MCKELLANVHFDVFIAFSQIYTDTFRKDFIIILTRNNLNLVRYAELNK